ncbi:MAG: tRNA lysidine(34) synthetase TilS [Methylocystaceae bacterium]|nr:MAG: tRNA lysidine(34) synthetase TilS [Methylocystaceae bacterium]
MPADPAPLLDPEWTLASLAEAGPLLLAVSGGPDSVALMLLAARWSMRARREIAVATVDHGLRPESAEETRLVGDWARDLGFAHHALSWDGAKPKTRIQERARAARYRLLAQCAHEIGATAIVTAHHADDQAETILFRLTRGSGVAGLAGMAAISRLGELSLMRPLLAFRKLELEAYCVASNHPFLRDPSNENPAFARARLRRLRGLLEDQGLDTRALLRLGARAARAEAALAWSAARAAASLPAEREPDLFRTGAAPLRTLPHEILQRILASEIARIGASPRMERLERMVEKLTAALEAEATLRVTLGGTLIMLADEQLSIEREAPRADRLSRKPKKSHARSIE